MFEMNKNSSSNSLDIFRCLEQIHFGFLLTFISTSLCILLGTPGHAWFLWLSLRAGWKIKPTQVLPLNQTLLELLFCICLLLNIVNILFFQNTTVFFSTCLLFGLSWTCKPLIQTCICIEQYLAVLHPVIFLRHNAIHYRTVSAAIAWLMSSGYGLCMSLAVVRFPDFIFVSVFFTAVTVISFCCVSVLRALKHPGPGDTQITMEKGRDVGNQQKRKAFKNIFAVLLSGLFSYLPQVSLVVFTKVEIDPLILQCDIVPFMTSCNICSILILLLLKLYKQSHVKPR